jgi:hypothetical protein
MPCQQRSAVSPWLNTSRLRSVQELLALREGPVLDFKSARIHAHDVAEVLVAFASANGGTVVFGVADDKTISGTSHDQSNVTELLRAPFDHREPPVSVQVEELPCHNTYGDAGTLAATARGSRTGRNGTGSQGCTPAGNVWTLVASCLM